MHPVASVVQKTGKMAAGLGKMQVLAARGKSPGFWVDRASIAFVLLN